MAEEYYIRHADSDSAKGPFDLDKLMTLADAGQVTLETEYYDDELESWVKIDASEEMKGKVFPEKKKLSLRAKDSFDSLNKEDEDGEKPAISVEDMLAAAEGESEETQHLRDKQRWEERAAAVSVPTIATILLVSALSYIYPSWDMIQGLIDGETGAVQRLFLRPLVFLGAFDLIMAALMYLNATEIFPLLRFRAMFGLGYFGFTYWAAYLTGDTSAIFLAGAVAAYGIGLFVCTLTLNFKLMVTSTAVGLGGVLVFAWFTNLKPLLEGLE